MSEHRTSEGGRHRWYRCIFRKPGEERNSHVGVEAHTVEAARDVIEDVYGVRPRSVSFLGWFGDDGLPAPMRRGEMFYAEELDRV